MYRKRVVIASLLLLIAVSLALSACNKRLNIGDLQTKSQTVELGDPGPVTVAIEMGAGELDVSGGASELLQASFTYNVAEMDPQATYKGARLEVKDSGVEGGTASLFDLDEFRNEWDLKLNEEVPMQMTVDLGAGRSNLTLGALELTSLTIRGGAGNVELDLSGSQFLRQLDFEIGAGETTVDLTGPWQNDLDARLSGGLGKFTLRVPADVGVRIDVETGVGSVNANGLTKDGDTYTNDAYGHSEVTLQVEVVGGVGQINVEVE